MGHIQTRFQLETTKLPRSERTPSFEWLDVETTQKLMDSLQWTLDSNVNDGAFHKKSLGLLRYLSKLFQTLPLSLIVEEITVVDRFPVAGGGFADIWRGTLNNNNSESPVCVKVLRLVMEQDVAKRDKIRKQFLNEALLWRQLKHPNILPLLGVNMELFSPSFCLISPWMKNRDIVTYLKENPEHDLSLVLYEIAAGMHYLHSRDPPFVHGDIRGGNILVTDDLHCCVADFGLTLVTPNSHLTASLPSSSSGSVNGAVRWLAPEYITFGAGSPPPNHTSRDVYAFACTIVEILTFKLPFHDYPNDVAVIFALINAERPARPLDVWYPDDIWDLTSRCWAQASRDRPSGVEIYEMLAGRITPSPPVPMDISVSQSHSGVNDPLSSVEDSPHVKAIPFIPNEVPSQKPRILEYSQDIAEPPEIDSETTSYPPLFTTDISVPPPFPQWAPPEVRKSSSSSRSDTTTPNMNAAPVAAGLSEPVQAPPLQTPMTKPELGLTRKGVSAPSSVVMNKLEESSILLDDPDASGWLDSMPPKDMNEILDQFFSEHSIDEPIEPGRAKLSIPMRLRAPDPLNNLPDPTRRRTDPILVRNPDSTLLRLRGNKINKRSTRIWGSNSEEVVANRNDGRKDMDKSALGGLSDPDSPLPIDWVRGEMFGKYKWVRGEMINKGAYSSVYLGVNVTSGELLVAKLIEVPQTTSELATRQLGAFRSLDKSSENWKTFSHPNVVQFLGHQQTSSHYELFSEYLPGGSLRNILIKHGRLSQNVTKLFMNQILSGIKFLNSRGIVHGNLKADSIFVQMDGICKISDFGFSKRMRGTEPATLRATIFWMAPEAANKLDKAHTFKIDSWGVGCVLLEMWTGARPWNGLETYVLVQLIFGKAPPVPESLVLSELADHFRRRCFIINPDERPNPTELKEHEYLVLPRDWIFSGFSRVDDGVEV
ncbi:hypothetical protein D9757_009420 [Collybiopsis confluens]|uniref:Protein kinase domain-containing protein n=1 Tax=Collybiopsis confluens TaxID=2823264 RepID=A0A8H5HDC4_9AGAR|nr:hypothetical protein D9757_009420 [Collybiopsis confluens]